MSLLSPDELKNVLLGKNRSLIHFNARSLRKNYDAINNFIASLHHSFSVICISETWLCNADCNLYGFPSYQAEYCHRMSSIHGGAAIFISPEIKYSRRQDLSINVPQCETVWIEIDKSFFSECHKNIVLGIIYRSPSSSTPDFVLGLASVFSKVSAENKCAVIVGDININLLDTTSTHI